MPVANYAPEMLALFVKASKEPVTIKLPTRKAATNLRFRLHNLRQEMRKEQHHMLFVAEGVTISLSPQPDGTNNPPTLLIARPADTSYLDALHKAGINVDDLDDAAAISPEPAAGDPSPGLDAIRRIMNSDSNETEPETE